MTRVSRRAERAAEAARMRADGMLLREIAEVMGLSKSMVNDLLQDPTGEAARARKARYARPCADCGKTINPNGPRPEITRCNRCEPRHNAAWDRERIIAALRDFYDEHGRAPTAGEMGSGPYRDDRLESLPLGATVRRHFGSVAAALEEAGIPPNRVGRWVHSPRPGDLVGRGAAA